MKNFKNEIITLFVFLILLNSCAVYQGNYSLNTAVDNGKKVKVKTEYNKFLVYNGNRYVYKIVNGNVMVAELFGNEEDDNAALEYLRKHNVKVEYRHLIEEPALDWVLDNLPTNASVAIDPRMHSSAWLDMAQAKLAENRRRICSHANQP